MSWARHAAPSTPMMPVCNREIKSPTVLPPLHSQCTPGVSPTCGQRGEEWCQLFIKLWLSIEVQNFPIFAASFVLICHTSPRCLMLISFFDAIRFYSINKAATKLNIFSKVGFFLMSFSTFTNLKYIGQNLVTWRIEIYHFVCWLVFLFCLLKILYMLEPYQHYPC